MPAPDTIACDKLARLIGTPGCPLLIDLEAPDRTVPGAVPRDAARVAEWAGALAAGAAIVIDDTGGATAHGVAAWLRSEGCAAEVLAGGRSAWQAGGHPLVALAALPPRQADGRTLWVTRARPKVDRIACPWLIRRFVDPHARVLFVPAADVLAVAERTGATPFDIEGDRMVWSHRGELCTFDVMIEAFGLDGVPALTRLATIVRAADTDRLGLAPEAAGLLAISLGLSRVHADDLAQLEAGMLVYDALYRWCRDAQGETHDWTSHQPARAPTRSKVSA